MGYAIGMYREVPQWRVDGANDRITAISLMCVESWPAVWVNDRRTLVIKSNPCSSWIVNI